MKKFIVSVVLSAAIAAMGFNTAFALNLTEIDLSALECDKTRGTAVEVNGLTFKDSSDATYGIDRGKTTVTATYTKLGESASSQSPGCYRLTPNTGRYLISKNSFSLKPNRSYLISALINCEYDRSTCEVSMGFEEFDENGGSVLRNYIGTAAQTDGWQRFEGTVTTSSRTKSGKFSLSLYGFAINDTENKFYISDLNILELPTAALTPLAPGEGMVFGGSSGMYDMRVKSVSEKSDSITVQTTGAEYIFDKNADTVTAYQLINGKRLLFTADCGKSLTNLSVESQSTNEAVLTTGTNGVTFGIQMDSLMLISNHGSADLNITCQSAVAGRWNRLSQGNLMVKDDTGGFTVNPYIPMGTGRLARYTAGSGVDFDGVVNNTSFISQADPGWKVSYTISSGELLGMSVFPARVYDWKASFENTYANYYRAGNANRFAEDAQTYGVDVALLWDYTQRGWGMSFGNRYVPINESVYQAHINSAHSAEMKAIAYMGLYYWHNRDVDEYINEVKRHRDTYGIDGIYSDGLPDKEWLAAYEGARKLRGLFPDGVLIFHTTGQDGNGGPPMAVPDISIPAIDAYSTMTLRGEGVEGDGADWEYPKNITSAYNTSNSIGIMKGDAWKEDGEVIGQERQNLINLLYNGRARLETRSTYMEQYKDILKKLKINHAFLSKNGDYYNKGYLPYVHRLVRTKLDFPENTVLECDFESSSDLAGWDIFGSQDVSVFEKDSNGVLFIDDSVSKELGGASYSFGEHIGLLSADFKIMADDGAAGEMYITDSNQRKLLGIQIAGGELRYYGRIGGYRKIAQCTDGEWQSIQIRADSTSSKFDVYVNGEKLVNGAYFALGTGFPAKINLSSSAYAAGPVYYDNVAINLGF